MQSSTGDLSLNYSKSDSRMSKAHEILSSMNLMEDDTQSLNLTPRPTFGRFGLGESFNDSFTGLHESVLNESTLFKDPAASAMKSITNSEPVYAAYMSLFSDFRQVLIDNNYGDLIDMASSYEQLCVTCEVYMKNLLGEMADGPGRQAALHMIKLMNCEKQTWRLVVSLYRDRLLSSEDRMESDGHGNEDASYKSEKEIVQNFMKNNDQIRQAQVVVDWLEINAADKLDASVESIDQHLSGVMWENSLYLLKKTSERGETPHAKYVFEMDPDAPTRQKRALMDLDLEDESKFLHAIHACVRAGRVQEAQELCVSHGQAWRAATLEGWRLYHDPNFSSTVDECMLFEGNPTRLMWKSTCWSLAQDCSYPIKERALYGALSGNLTAMLDDCSTWHDCVWAHYKALIDMEVEKHLLEAHNARVPTQRRYLFKHAGEALKLPDKFWSQKVDVNEQEKMFDTIAASKISEVCREAEQPHNVAQRCIILNSIGKLVEEMCSWMDADNFDPQVLRFLSHLLLFLRDLGESLELESFNQLMLKYVKFLSGDARTSGLVATYCSALPKKMQVEAYADLLESIEETNMRREYFELGSNAGLQIDEITRTVVDRIRSVATTQVCLEMDEAVDQSITQQDMYKINSLEWLIIDNSQRFDAIHQCNAMMRTFLGAGKFDAASEAYKRLPADSIDLIYREWKAKTGAAEQVPIPAACENAINENLCILSYLEAQTSFQCWFKHFHSDKPKVSPASSSTGGAKASLNSSVFQPLAGNVSLMTMVADEQRRNVDRKRLEEWNERLMALCKDACNKIYNVLLFPDGGWLVDKRQDDDDTDDTRRHQMNLLRQLCIPLLCNLLLTVLRNTEGRSAECQKLADIIADERNRIYALFTKAEGRKFFGKIQDVLIDCI